MSRYTKKVIISYDADEAGRKAAARALALLEEVGLEVKVLSVPGAKDPDEYIKAYGKDKFRDVLFGAKSKFDYNLESVLSRFDISLPQDKINALGELEKIISRVYSKAERDVYISIVAKKLGVQASAISADVERIIEKNTIEYKRNEGKRLQRDSIGYQDRTNPDFIKQPAIARNEENVLALLLIYPEHRARVFNDNLLSEDDFFTELNRRVFLYLKESYAEGDLHLVDMNERFTQDEVSRISKIKRSRLDLVNNGDEVLSESIDSLKKSMDRHMAKKTDTIDSLNEMLKRKRSN